MNWKLVAVKGHCVRRPSMKWQHFIFLILFFLSAPWAHSQPADNREWINNFIAEINTDLQAAGTMVGKNSYSSARDKLRQTAEKLRGEIGHFAALVQENKQAYPDWEVDTFETLPEGLNAALYEGRYREFTSKYRNNLVPELELAELRMKQRQLLGAVQIMSTALVTFVEAYNTATGTDTLSAGALYLFGSDLQSMAAEAKQRAEDIEAGLLKVNNARQAYQELYDLALRMQDMRRRLLEGARIAKALASEMKGVQELIDYYRDALAEAQSITLPTEVAQPTFSATPYIDALNNLMTGLNALKLPWGDATSLANKTYARADTDYEAYDRNQTEAAEWDRFSDKWAEWEALLAQRNADLASLNNKVAEIQTLLDGVNQDYAAIEIPPTPLNDELQGLGSLSSADEALIGVIDTPWQSQVRWSNGTDATVFSDSTGALALSNAYSSSSWVRPDFMVGEQAAIDYLQHLWSSGRGALRWANATRASVASQAYEQWHARPYRWDGQAFSVSVLNGNQMRTVRDNLYAFQDEAAAFTAVWEDISATAAAIAARRDEIEDLALALATWLEERPITLPAAEMAYRIRFTGPSGEQAWIRFEAILSKISQLGGEAPLIAAAAGREAEWLEQQCQVALDLVEDDIAFNAELSASGEKAVRAADLLAMFRGDYQGKNYPGYLYDALAETDEHLRAHFLPDIYKIYLNDVLLEDHGEHLRFYLDYLDSLPGWTLRNLTEWVQEIRAVSDHLINARWRHLLGQTWNFDMEAYHEDGGQGRIIFPENRDMVDAAINTRWGGSRSNVEPGDPNRGRTWSEDAGFLSMEEIRLGLPKLRSFVASLPSQDGGTTPPPANYSISQGPNPYLSENGRSANQVKVSVALDGSPAPASTPVICEFDIGATMPMRLLTFTNEAAEAHFTLDVGLPTGALALSFSIDNQDLLTWNVSVDSDSDGDGLGDLKELDLGMDPDFDWDGLLDSDGDGLSDAEELLLGTDPFNPDSDGDGVSDGDEVANGSDPFRPFAPRYADDPILAPPTRVVGRDWISLGDLPLGDGLEPSIYGDPGEVIRAQFAAFGRIWIFTATQNPNPFIRRVWWSADGETWEMAPYTMPQDFYPVHYFQFDDQLASMDSYGRVSLSADGIEWTLLSDEPAPWAVQDGYSGRSGFGITVFNEQIHVAGGRGIIYPPPAYRTDHWSTADGISWTQVAEHLDFLENRRDFFMGSVQDQLVIAFGTDDSAGDNYTGFYGTMVSADGTTWSYGSGALQLPTPPGNGPWMRGRFFELSGSLYFEAQAYDLRLSHHFARYRWTGQQWTTLYSDSGTLASMPTVPFMGAQWRFWLNGYEQRYKIDYSGNLLGFEPVHEEQFPVYANARHIAAGSSHAVVIALDGSLWAWGGNSSGQLGQGHANPVENAVQIGGRTDWKQVAAGQASSYALSADGDLYAWGYNGSGQLGLGDENKRLSPELVGQPGEWADVQAGDYHVVAIKTDGSVWTWGSNSKGQLGVPTGSTGIYSSPNPVQPQTLESRSYVRAVATGNFSAAIGQDGALASSKYWGERLPPNYNAYPLTFPSNDIPLSSLHWAGRNFYLSPEGKAADNNKGFEPNRTWAALAGTVESGVGIQFNNTLMAWDPDRPEPRLIGEDYDWIAVVKRASSDAYLLQKADSSFWTLPSGTDTPLPVDPFGPNYAADIDGDGLPDYWERRFASTDWTDQADAAFDVANDGLTTLEEFAAGTNPDLWDTDGDGLGDGYELRYGGDPLTPLQPEGAWLEWLSEWVPADWQEGDPLYTFALHRSGDTLFAYMAGLRIIDMSDPQAPAEIGFWNAEVNFDHVSGTLFLQDFATQGDHLLIATGSSGWLLMDVADPANLEMIATGFDHECGQLAVDGEWIAMGEQWQRSAVHIYRWDAANLPVKTASIPTDYYDGNIALGNGLLAIPRSAGGLLLYQLIEGTEPELVAEWTDAATIDSMVWRGDLLYASGKEAGGRTGLWFLKFEGGALTPVKPFQERSPTQRNSWLALAEESEQLIHLMSGNHPEPGTLSVGSTVNPLAPAWSTPWSGDALSSIWNPGLAIFGDYLLLGNGDGGIQVLEIFTTDSDGDGLPDDWEIAQFGDLRYSGEDDPDNDGLSNFLEYHVGTDPLSADSNGDGMSDGDSVHFGFDPLGSIQPPTLPPQVGISVPAQGMLRLDFDPGGDAAAVVLESSVDLIEWTPVEITPAVNGSQHQWDITLPADDSRFYRIRH